MAVLCAFLILLFCPDVPVSAPGAGAPDEAVPAKTPAGPAPAVGPAPSAAGADGAEGGQAEGGPAGPAAGPVNPNHSASDDPPPAAPAGAAPDGGDPEPPLLWEARLELAHRAYQSPRPNQTDTSLMLRRKFEGGSVALGVLRTERFNRWDKAVLFDGYLDLWKGAYANLTFQYSPDGDVLPKTEGSLELFQGLGRGWEVSGSYRRRENPVDNIESYGLMLGKYFGDDWYVRIKGQVIHAGGQDDTYVSAAVRRYLGSTDDYVELGGGFGSEPVDIAPGPTVLSRDTDFANLRLQTFFTRSLGLSAGLMYTHEQQGPDGWGFGLGLITRW